MKTNSLVLRLIAFCIAFGASCFAQTPPSSVTLNRYFAPPSYTGYAPQLLGEDTITINYTGLNSYVTYSASAAVSANNSRLQVSQNITVYTVDWTRTDFTLENHYYEDSPVGSQPPEDDTETNDGSENLQGYAELPILPPLNVRASSSDGIGVGTNLSMYSRKCPCEYAWIAGVEMNFFLGTVSMVQDPMQADAAFGPETGTQMSYDAGDTSALGSPRYTNMGPRWKLNWVQFVEEAPGVTGKAWLNMGRGGKAVMKVPAGSTVMTRPGLSLDTLERAIVHGAVEYTHTLTDGTKEKYSIAGGVGSNGRSRYFLKSVTDVYGNTATLTWQFHPSGVRLSKLTDAAGRVTKFVYDNGLKPMRLTRILDPFHRETKLEYHANGELWRMTDPAGMVTEYIYEPGSGGAIATVNTPYGSTAFTRGNVLNAANEVVGTFTEALDPAGRRQRVERLVSADLSPLGVEGVPSGFDATRLGIHNTFFWNEAAIAGAGAAGVPLSAANAQITKWAERPGTNRAAPLPASVKAPLTHRVWYQYAGATSSSYVGSHSGVATVGRMFPAGQALPLGMPSYEITQMNFNAKGRPTTVTDFFGRQTIFTYGTAGQNPALGADDTDVTGVSVSALGTSVTLQQLGQYQNHRPTQLTAVDGTVTQVAYNTRGQVSTLTDALGRVTTLTYRNAAPGFGRVETVTDPSGTTTLTYDAYDRLQSVTNAQGETTTVEYDAIGGAPLKTLNRVTKVTHPNGQFERVVWDKLDVAESYDIEGKKTTYEHDAARRVLSLTGPDNKTISYIPGNCCGSIDTLVDAGGKKTHWKYDILGRVTEKWLNWAPAENQGAPVRVQSITYDEWGRAVTKTDARGNVRTLVYDEQNRMKDIQYTIPPTLPDGTTPNPTAPTPDVHLVYETLQQSPFGRLVRVESEDGTGFYDAYEYVPFNAADTVYGDGRVKKTSKGSQYSNIYTYDALGRVSSTVLEAAGQPVGGSSNVWDTLGRLTHRTNLLGTQELHYDGATGRVSWMKTGGLRTDYAYSPDANHRLNWIGSTWNGSWNGTAYHSYGYDSAGRLDTWTRNRMPEDAGDAWKMLYDASEQIESVAVTSWGANPPAETDLHLYQYDASGNRTSEQRSGAVRSWSANAFNQVTEQTAGGMMELRGEVNPQSKVTVTPVNTAGTPIGGAIAATAESGATQWTARANVGAGVRRFSVKAEQTQVPAGTTPEITTRTLEVNVPAEQAVAFTYDADGNMLTNGVWAYQWDAENRLVGATSGTTAVTFRYDAFHRRVKIEEKQGTNTLSDKELMWEGLDIVAQREQLTGELRIYHGNGETRKLGSATTTLLYTTDHLGSIRELVDASSGAIRASYDYTPYGIRTKLSGDLESDFGYTGHYTNARTGLVFAPYRAYDPVLARWISRDPSEEDGGINLYGYVENGPIEAVDPLGEALKDWKIFSMGLSTFKADESGGF